MTPKRYAKIAGSLLCSEFFVALSAHAEEASSASQQSAENLFKWINFALVAGVIIWLCLKKGPAFFDRRADVIAYVREKYGQDCVAQIITFGTMGAKSVVRDVGRVMGLSYGDCDRLAKMIPNELKMSLRKALEQNPEFKQAYEEEEQTHELVDTALVLEDLTRNASVHAAGSSMGRAWCLPRDRHGPSGDGENTP